MNKIEYSDKGSINVSMGKKKLSEEVASLHRAFNFFSCGSFMANPDPVLRKAGKEISVYSEIKTDSHVKACVRSRKAGAKSMLWDIDRGKAQSKHAKFIKSVFDQLPIYQIVDDILEAPLFGYKPLEVYWAKQTVGQRECVIPTKIKGKPVDWFVFSDNGELLFRSKEHYLGEIVPDKKFLLPRQEATDDNPYGFPDLSLCFWYYTFKKGGLRFWLQFIEKYGMPFLIGKTPRGTAPEENAELLQTLEDMIQDAVAVIPDDGSVELVESSKATSSQVYKEFLYFLNSEVSKAILGQTLTTEIQDKGTYGAAKVHLEVRDDIIQSDVKLVEETFNTLIEWIIELNFGTVNEVPKFIMFREGDVDLNLAQRDKIITEMGFTFSQEYMTRAYFLQDSDIMPREVNPLSAAFSESDNNSNAEIDKLDAVFNDDNAVIYLHQIIKPIVKAIQNGKDFAECEQILYDKFPKLNDDDFQQLLNKAMFIAKGIVGITG